MAADSTTRTWFLPDEEATLRFGAAMATVLESPALVFLEGDLGAGKTTLSRGLLRGLGHQGSVKSPTYTLVEPYELGVTRVFHFDLYRVTDGGELAYLGLDDYFSTEALVLIEWPDRGLGWLATPDWHLVLAPLEEGRQISLTAHTDRGRDWLAAVPGTGADDAA